jgi:hypothetical protein
MRPLHDILVAPVPLMAFLARGMQMDMSKEAVPGKGATRQQSADQIERQSVDKAPE